MDQPSGKRRPPRSGDPSDAPEQWLDAAAAAGRLGIKRATLYAYVSRGQVTSRPAPDRRGRVYYAGDLERLRAQRDARSGHGAVAAGALRWGEPVLDSAITAIHPRGPAYRGRLAVELAAGGATLEEVAEWLWSGRERGPSEAWPTVAPATARAVAGLAPETRPLDVLQAGLPRLALHDPRRGDTAHALAVARRVVTGLPALLVAARSADRADGSIAAQLRSALGTDTTPTGAVEAIDAALVLCADHELNASSFASRVAASAGADLYACVSAALATLGGVHHGGVTERLARLVARIGAPERAARVVGESLRAGESVPGFGHRLYADGDPRAAPLLSLAEAVNPAAPTVRVLRALVDTVALIDGGRPTLDIGLTALAGALALRPGSALALFAVGRSVGWLAHAIEQRQAGFMLRPRARYTGPPVDPA